MITVAGATKSRKSGTTRKTVRQRAAAVRSHSGTSFSLLAADAKAPVVVIGSDINYAAKSIVLSTACGLPLDLLQSHASAAIVLGDELDASEWA
jgi:hypothetical protein